MHNQNEVIIARDAELLLFQERRHVGGARIGTIAVADQLTAMNFPL
jgi:hypothetical protein